MITDDKISNVNEYGDIEKNVVIEREKTLKMRNNTQIKSLYQKDEDNIIHHHCHLKEPVKQIVLKNMIKLNCMMNMIKSLETGIKMQRILKVGRKKKITKNL